MHSFLKLLFAHFITDADILCCHEIDDEENFVSIDKVSDEEASFVENMIRLHGDKREALLAKKDELNKLGYNLTAVKTQKKISSSVIFEFKSDSIKGKKICFLK